MSVINTNIKSLIAQQALNTNNRGLSKAMEQLSTGKRINTAADDAAGNAITSKMTAQIRGLNQAVRNANDGISMVQTVEGALNEVTNMLQRMRELALQSANGTYSGSDRTALNSEYSALKDEIKRISDKTTWNGIEVAGSAATTYQLQVGDAAGATMTVTFSDVYVVSNTASNATAVASAALMGVGTAGSAATAVTALDAAISTVDAYRSTLGSYINRLQYTTDNLTSVSTNTAASRSRIQDTDYAQATTELAKRQIIQQAATAMLAQANQEPSTVLTLLK
jgi:flagellin